MMCAEMAGIRIFVTGGIGGVHRGAEHTFDVSADLTELGRTKVGPYSFFINIKKNNYFNKFSTNNNSFYIKVAVVSAGAKSILDIPKTLEYLETQGVPVIGFKTDIFPEFFVSDSGFKTSARLETERDCAELIHMQFERLALSSGILITVPVPKVCCLK
jgi:pseudouridine-5'-phosphate glycosidase